MPLRIRKIYNLIGFITILRGVLAILTVVVDILKQIEYQEFYDKLVSLSNHVQGRTGPIPFRAQKMQFVQISPPPGKIS